jgi:NADP-dependent 3-hydroxy acid dehydrogenase YdfG
MHVSRENKIVIVTGAVSGISKETAILFSKEGVKIVAADFSVGGIQTLAKILRNCEGFFAQIDCRNLFGCAYEGRDW